MTLKKHTLLSATAAIAAALALPATPLAAQSVDTTAPAPAMQAEPAAPPAMSPAPTASLPDAGAASDASPAPAPDPASSMAPAATGASDSVAPVRQTSTHSTVTRTTTVTRTAPAAVAAPAVVPAAAPLSAPADIAPPAADLAPVAATPPLPAPEPTPTQSENVVGTLGVALLALLALAILAAGLMFFRRRHPAAVVATTDSEPVVTDEAYVPVAEPVAASASMHRLRDTKPVAGALPSDGAAVDLPARLPESYEERTALFDRMVAARPDKANPFTDRTARARRARLIMQSLGKTFDHEPRIDLSQYPNNWPELARQYHKAA